MPSGLLRWNHWSATASGSMSALASSSSRWACCDSSSRIFSSTVGFFGFVRLVALAEIGANAFIHGVRMRNAQPLLLRHGGAELLANVSVLGFHQKQHVRAGRRLDLGIAETLVAAPGREGAVVGTALPLVGAGLVQPLGSRVREQPRFSSSLVTSPSSHPPCGRFRATNGRSPGNAPITESCEPAVPC
jgi:hypothetical protein